MLMSDSLPIPSDDPDALPLNERSSAFIDCAAFLNFVRMKSLVAPQESSAAKNAATCVGGDGAPNAPSLEQDKAITHPAINAAMEAEIQPEDWDSLFGAIEERLRATVEPLDSATTQFTSQDKLCRIRSVVLDCVSSLDSLHMALRHDRGLQSPLKLRQSNEDCSDIWTALRPTNRLDLSRKNRSR
jgi:hypothetical protein